jgi:hypothetical protein
MAKLLYIGTAGTDDPTRATFPFLMAKGAIEAGHEADTIAAQIHGVGIPPLTELMEFVVARDVRISV